MCVISLHSEGVCVSIHTHIHTNLCMCFHDREGRYDQEQGICIMVSILGIYMSYHTFCATAIPRIQVQLFIMTKTTFMGCCKCFGPVSVRSNFNHR